MKYNNKNKGIDWEGGFIAIVVSIATCAIEYFFYQCRQDYRFKKEEENRRNQREDGKTAPEQTECQAEKDDPEEKLRKQDKEVKNDVIRTLGLDCVEALQGERVYPSDSAMGIRRTPLVGSLITKGDLCLVVSNPGVGKSNLAFQMADDIAEGRESKLFHLPEGHQPSQRVHYFDAELESDDIRERYPQGLSVNFNRIPISTPRRNVYYLLKDIIDIVGEISSDASLFIDNIAAAALGMDVNILFAGLKKIQRWFFEKGFRLTVIIVVHTTKVAKNKPDLEDVAGAAGLTRFARTVLFLNPTGTEGVVELYDGKRRKKKNKDSLLVVKGGEGSAENLHFEALENVMDSEEIQKLTKDLDDGSDTPKGPGRRQKLSEEDAKAIAERLDAGENAKDLAEEYVVCENTIKYRAKRYRKGKK